MESKTRVVIFAGGVGTRMWPLSRKATPKQFEKIIGEQSTLQLAVERVRPEVENEDIYISTGKEYVPIVSKQLPELPEKNIIGEPEMRDVAPAVGYLMSILALEDPDGPVAILWSDHLVKSVNKFKKALSVGAEYIRRNPNVFVFLGQKPRFANQNLGWIEYGDEIEKIDGVGVHKFVSWHYRPSLDQAKEYFNDGKHSWNPGYFVVAPRFVLEQYKKHVPEMYEILMKLQASYGKPGHEDELMRLYPQMEKISFDDAVVTKTAADKAVVLSVELGWSDVGTWDALKEALQDNQDANLALGNTELHETKNSLVYGYTDQMVTTVGVEDLVVVVTPDVVMVTRQDKIPEIKKMLSKFDGTDKAKYT